MSSDEGFVFLVCIVLAILAYRFVATLARQ